MSSPWLTIPLEDYEGHMRSPEVQQLSVLSELFQYALDHSRPESVAILGVAGGNGLAQIVPAITKRIVGLDINPRYIDAVRQRFAFLPGLELQTCDLTQQELRLPTVSLVHAALIFEHAGLGLALTNALSLVAPEGRLSVVLQMASQQEPGVSSTDYPSMQTLKHDFTLIDIDQFRDLLTQKNFQLVAQETRSLPAGKAFWLGLFARSA